MPVFLEVVHTVKPLTPKAFDTFVEIYGDIVVPAFANNGWDLLGAWKWSTGAVGRDLMLVRFDSLAALEKAMGSLVRDPAYARSIAAFGKAGLEIAETASTAAPVPYATVARLDQALAAKPDSPRQYLHAQLDVKMGGQPKAYQLLGELADGLAAAGALDLATAYEAAIGQRGRLTDIWVLPNGVGDLSYRAGSPVNALLEALREVAPEESLNYINPLPYSPLQ